MLEELYDESKIDFKFISYFPNVFSFIDK